MTFRLNWVAASGTLLLIAGLITIPVLRIGLARAAHAYVTTLKQLKWAIITVVTVLALAYVMNASGQTITLGLWVAGAGGIFAFISAMIGWFGVAVTGSDTSSNSLFGALQVAGGQGRRAVAGLDGGRQLVRWCAGKDGLAAESGDRRRGRGPRRQGGRRSSAASSGGASSFCSPCA